MKDISGKKIGKLTVIEKDGTRDKKTNCKMWKCICDCGKTCYKLSGDLLRAKRDGRLISCGCKDSVNGTRIATLRANVRYDSKTGYKGVSFDSRTHKYRAYIVLRNKQKYLGSFYKLEDAVKARQNAEDELFKPIIEEFCNDYES